MAVRTFKKGEFLVREGEVITAESCCYLILKGRCHVRANGDFLCYRVKGESIGETGVVKNQSRDADVIAISAECQCACMPRALLLRAIDYSADHDEHRATILGSLRRTDSLSQLSEKELQSMTDEATIVQFKPDSFLMRQSDDVSANSCCFVILDGHVTERCNGELSNTRFMGDIVGLDSLLAGGSCSADALAEGKVQCAAITHKSLSTFLAQHSIPSDSRSGCRSELSPAAIDQRRLQYSNGPKKAVYADQYAGIAEHVEGYDSSCSDSSCSDSDDGIHSIVVPPEQQSQSPPLSAGTRALINPHQLQQLQTLGLIGTSTAAIPTATDADAATKLTAPFLGDAPPPPCGPLLAGRQQSTFYTSPRAPVSLPATMKKHFFLSVSFDSL
jgi:CRP-like cAMP-binding protein